MNTKLVELYYPRQIDPECVQAVEIELTDCRAARNIRVTYDFDRDGYVISVGDDPYDGYAPGDTADTVWTESAFVPAWPRASDAELDSRLDHLVPIELHEAYRNNPVVCEVFKSALYAGATRERALIQIALSLAEQSEYYRKEYLKVMSLGVSNVVIYSDPRTEKFST